MLIVEGADLTGKTTICKEILAHPKMCERGAIYQHLSRLPAGWDPCSHYCEAANAYAVQDRFHMSEVVYSKVRGEPSIVSPLLYAKIQKLIQPYTIVMSAYLSETLRQRWRHNEMYSFNQVLEANEIYKDLDSKLSRYGITVQRHIVCEELTSPGNLRAFVDSVVIDYFLYLEDNPSLLFSRRRDDFI